MPEFPEKKSISTGYANFVSFNPNIPVVHSISSGLLAQNGWEKIGNEYVKGDSKLTYDGTFWKLNGERVEFMEDLGKKNSDTRPE